MTCEVAIIAEAEQQLASIDEWWRENRGAAPDLFLDEFVEGIDLLSEMPDIGSLFDRANRPGIRRLLLRRSKYWIYYFHERQRSIVYVLAIWSTYRGSDPPLRQP